MEAKNVLGELYEPHGLALETANAVLEVKHPFAVNVALGCPNGCSYCYGPLSCKVKRENWTNMRTPKEAPTELVRKQLAKMFEKEPLLSMSGFPRGVFLSFFTDCFHPDNRKNTEDLIDYLTFGLSSTQIATSSKLGIYEGEHGSYRIKNGISLVSIDERFWKTFEPNAASPKDRLKSLCVGHERGFSWLSMEPYPSSAIWKQDLNKFLEEVTFWGVDLIVFGKWNYDKRASTEEARLEYKTNVNVLVDFCKSNKIRLHVKSETLDFVNGGKRGR
ncbi:MAG: hypothetical protein NWF06_00745 [Candidatus Bathyarchaeota archaeon]|nr:hypothetical protein [Candidatus Bathyarchaeum sp.]